MVHLLAKSQAIDAKLKSLDLEIPRSHLFWTLAFPMSELLARELVKTGQAIVWWDRSDLIATSSTVGWHSIAETLSRSEEEMVRRFVPVLLNSALELFKDLPRRQEPNGQLTIWR